MSSPYQSPPSAFPDEPPSDFSTSLPGFSLRRSSYASVASGAGPFSRSGATFAQLLNPNNGDAANTNGNSRHSNGGTGALLNHINAASPANGSTQTLFHFGEAMATDTQRDDTDAGGNDLLHWLDARNAQLPSFSRAYEPFFRGPLFEGAAVTTTTTTSVPPITPSSNSGFFTPSYLRDSVYAQRLESQLKARARSLADPQRFQKLLHLDAASNGGILPGIPDPMIGGGGADGMAASIGITGLSAPLGSSSGLHGGLGASIGTRGRGPASHRGQVYGVVEKQPSSSYLLDGGEELPNLPLLPSRWNVSDKPPALEVLSDGLDVKYAAATIDREQEASSIRADHYMPPQCGIYYFEITVLSKKKDDSTIGIGFSDASVSLTRPPGWEPKSWGYHSDDGNIFYAHSTGKKYGPTFCSGDVVGCGINFRTGTAFFTKNGEYLDTAFRGIKGAGQKLYPTVGLKKTGEHLRVNFGQVPFAFDIDSMVKNVRLSVNNEISAARIDRLVPSLSESDLVQRLVLEFLQHDGYVETARAFAEEIQSEKEALNLDPDKEIPGINIADDEDARNRQRIRQTVLEGDIDSAFKLTNMYYPDLLEEEEMVFFRLQCRKFIEMIRQEAELNLVGGADNGTGLGANAGQKQANGHGAAKNARGHPTNQDMDMDDIDMVEADTDGHAENGSLIEEAISYGQALRAQYANDTRPEIQDALGEIFSLLAYANPLKENGVAHLLDQTGRAAVAENLNSVILQYLGKSSRAALEVLYSQTSVLLEDLRESGGPGSFVTIQELVDQIPKSTF